MTDWMISPKHKKQFGVYHWDTFDNSTFFLEDFPTLDSAEKFVKKRYGERLADDGADKVDIVRLYGGVLVRSFSVR